MAKEFFGVDGAAVQETMNGYDGFGDKTVNPYTCLYLTTGTEVAYQLYQYYLYTRDETFLKEKVYPLMKEVIAFHLNFLNKEADGLYHVYPSDTRNLLVGQGLDDRSDGVTRHPADPDSHQQEAWHG